MKWFCSELSYWYQRLASSSQAAFVDLLWIAQLGLTSNCGVHLLATSIQNICSVVVRVYVLLCLVVTEAYDIFTCVWHWKILHRAEKLVELWNGRVCEDVNWKLQISSCCHIFHYTGPVVRGKFMSMSTAAAVQAFIKRLLQVCQLFSPPLICASLILLSELLKTRPTLLRLSKLAEVDDSIEWHFISFTEENPWTSIVNG